MLTTDLHTVETLAELPEKLFNTISDDDDDVDAEASNKKPACVIKAKEKVEPEKEEKSISSTTCLQTIQRSVDKQINEEKELNEMQCRVCTKSNDLLSIFELIDDFSIAEILMSICPSVVIKVNDNLPQFLCMQCLENVKIAWNLKKQCESTDTELRKKLSRSRAKMRKPMKNYEMLDDAHNYEISESSSLLTESIDEEFKVSLSDELSDDSDEDSYYGLKRKRNSRASRPRGRGGDRRLAVTSKGRKKRTVRSLGLIKTSTTDDDPDYTQPKAQINLNLQNEPTVYRCLQCKQMFRKAFALKIHSKVHERDNFKCDKCGKEFRTKGTYRSHLDKHETDFLSYRCDQCPLNVATKAELRRHLAEDHIIDEGQLFECLACKKSFVSANRLAKHKATTCAGLALDSSLATATSTKQKRNQAETLSVRQELFKTAAPLTTTFWSDSFSD